jgi:large subunit ribosomal protein L24
MKIKKGDNVIVIAGKDKGKTGKITKALPRDNKVVIEGINLRKKHQRAARSGAKGQIVERALPIHVSNVMAVDTKTGKGTRHPKR